MGTWSVGAKGVQRTARPTTVCRQGGHSCARRRMPQGHSLMTPGKEPFLAREQVQTEPGAFHG